MSVQTIVALRSPRSLQWWEWGKILGAAGLVGLTVSLVAGHVPHPTLAAVLLHVAADFTLQSTEVALGKGNRGRHLAAHALAAGGLPLALAGLAVGPESVLVWAAAGAASHYAVDWTRKFGISQTALAVVLDQGCHLLTILALTTQ